jgi:hypothetical protein
MVEAKSKRQKGLVMSIARMKLRALSNPLRTAAPFQLTATLGATISTRSLIRRMVISEFFLLAFFFTSTIFAESPKLSPDCVLHPISALVASRGDLASLEKSFCTTFLSERGSQEYYHVEHAHCGLPFANSEATIDVKSGKLIRVSLALDKSYCLNKQIFERQFPGGKYTLGADWAREVYALNTDVAKIVSTYDDKADSYGCMLDLTVIFKIDGDVK